MGAGSIGGFFGAQALRCGHDVLLCTRSPFEKLVLERGDQRTDFEVSVFTHPEAARDQSPVDWILLATKTHQTAAAAGWLAALRGPATRAIAVLQNGVEHRDRVRAFVGDTPVLPTTVLCAAEAVEPGRIVHHGYARLELPAGELADEFAALFRGSDVEILPCDDFTSALWRKLLTNIAASGITALTGQRLRVVARPELRSLVLGLVRECISVANADGAQLSESEALPLVEMYANVPAEMGSSMLYDRMAGRPLEWQAIYGAVARIGARHGISTPFNEALAGLLAVISEPEA